jgi:hypothetical protein
MLGQDGDLDLAFLNEKDGVGDFALAENLLVFLVIVDAFSGVWPAKKSLGIKSPFGNPTLYLRRVGHGVAP